MVIGFFLMLFPYRKTWEKFVNTLLSHGYQQFSLLKHNSLEGFYLSIL